MGVTSKSNFFFKVVAVLRSTDDTYFFLIHWLIHWLWWWMVMMMMDADVYMSVTYIHKIYKSFCVSCSECCWIPSVAVADSDDDDNDDDTHTSTHSSYCTDYLLVRSWFTSWCLRIDRRWVGLLSHHPHLSAYLQPLHVSSSSSSSIYTTTTSSHHYISSSQYRQPLRCPQDPYDGYCILEAS
jgi:hypothetical protein